jgi:hypothetical protein
MVVTAGLCCFKLHPDKRQLRMVSLEDHSHSRVQAPSVQTGADARVVRSCPGPAETGFGGHSPHVWNARISCIWKPATAPEKITPKIETERPAATTNLRSGENPLQATTLSIRAEPTDDAAANALSVQCRTSCAVSNIHGTAVSIQGVVTQEVVSSSGKILILAGSRVVGSAILDVESNRFKSDGQWSIHFNDTELKVHARLLDRPHGLSGIIGHVRAGKTGNSGTDSIPAANRLIVVPANSPFTLDARGEIELRDLASNETLD